MTYELRPNSICNLGWYGREESWFGRHFLSYNKNMTIDEIRATSRPINAIRQFEDISPPNSPGFLRNVLQPSGSTVQQRVLLETPGDNSFRLRGNIEQVARALAENPEPRGNEGVPPTDPPLPPVSRSPKEQTD